MLTVHFQCTALWCDQAFTPCFLLSRLLNYESLNTQKEKFEQYDVVPCFSFTYAQEKERVRWWAERGRRHEDKDTAAKKGNHNAEKIKGSRETFFVCLFFFLHVWYKLTAGVDSTTSAPPGRQSVCECMSKAE